MEARTPARPRRVSRGDHPAPHRYRRHSRSSPRRCPCRCRPRRNRAASRMRRPRRSRRRCHASRTRRSPPDSVCAGRRRPATAAARDAAHGRRADAQTSGIRGREHRVRHRTRCHNRPADRDRRCPSSRLDCASAQFRCGGVQRIDERHRHTGQARQAQAGAEQVVVTAVLGGAHRADVQFMHRRPPCDRPFDTSGQHDGRQRAGARRGQPAKEWIHDHTIASTRTAAIVRKSSAAAVETRRRHPVRLPWLACRVC
ncbi:hypothetical protein RLIN73S_04134 [Rhodanobacter lindaniclasticus]